MLSFLSVHVVVWVQGCLTLDKLFVMYSHYVVQLFSVTSGFIA